MSLLSHTLGRIMPRYRTLRQWGDVYSQIIGGRPISDKTKANRRSALVHVMDGLGSKTISAIRPHEVASLINGIALAHPSTAKRVLFEARDVFDQAINYGWIDRNPASAVKPPVVRVQRKRLTLEQWQAIHAQAMATMPPWVAHMMTLALVTGQRRSDLVKMKFSDVWDDHLHIEQLKTGARLALPLTLKLDALDLTLQAAIAACSDYAVGKDYLLRKHNGQQLVDASLSARFEEARDAALPASRTGHPPSLHECRSLAERLYRMQGINTMVLLGHKHQSMTDMYHDDRGLTKGEWKTLSLA